MTTDALLADMLATIVRWAAQQPDMLAAALVGSHARDAARVDSDVDIMLIVTDPDRFATTGSGSTRLLGHRSIGASLTGRTKRMA